MAPPARASKQISCLKSARLTCLRRDLYVINKLSAASFTKFRGLKYAFYSEIPQRCRRRLVVCFRLYVLHAVQKYTGLKCQSTRITRRY